jgi:hypothetical protein
VLIFVERGHQKAAQIIEDSAERFLSANLHGIIAGCTK